LRKSLKFDKFILCNLSAKTIGDTRHKNISASIMMRNEDLINKDFGGVDCGCKDFDVSQRVNLGVIPL
jgi:hypothetical protein